MKKTVQTKEEAKQVIRSRFEEIVRDAVLVDSDFKRAEIYVMPDPMTIEQTDKVFSIRLYNVTKLRDHSEADTDINVEFIFTSIYDTRDEDSRDAMWIYLDDQLRDSSTLRQSTLDLAMENYDKCMSNIELPNIETYPEVCEYAITDCIVYGEIREAEEVPISQLINAYHAEYKLTEAEAVYGSLTEEVIDDIIRLIRSIYGDSNMAYDEKYTTLRNIIKTKIRIKVSASLSGSGIDDVTSHEVIIGLGITDKIEFYIKWFDQAHELIGVSLISDASQFIHAIRTILRRISDYFDKVTDNEPIVEFTFCPDIIEESLRENIMNEL